jgi:hypothetical protein
VEDRGVFELLRQPWPWWIAGPLIGLMVPALLLFDGKSFGISSSLQHLCATLPVRRPAFLRYDGWREGGWNLLFALGAVAGGAVGAFVLSSPEPLAVAPATAADLAELGIGSATAGLGLLPEALYGEGWSDVRQLLVLLFGGFLVGFGARWAGGCTSGHGITGLASAQWPSLVAVVGFFIGGLLTTHVLLPWIF